MSSSSDGAGKLLYRYEDLLRAIGRYIDEHQVQDVVLLQSEQGILLRGFRIGTDRTNRGRQLVQHMFSNDDLTAIDEEARRRRGKGTGLFR